MVVSLALSSAMFRKRSSPPSSGPELSAVRLVCRRGRAAESYAGEASLEPAMRSVGMENERVGVCCLGQVPDTLIGGPRDVSP